jgi:hypothetical protein
MEETTKVYLAKSNRANPDVVSSVRQTLSKYDVEVVEFKGGTYSHKQLLDCDMMVIVPATDTIWREEGIILGKGLFEQLEAFEEHSDIGTVMVVCDEQLTIGEIDSYWVENKDDYIDYGLMDFYDNDGELNLKEHCDMLFNMKTTTASSSKSSYYHLLVNKIK